MGRPSGLICTVENCGKKRYGWGYCRNHYRRFITYGDPLGGGPSPTHTRMGRCAVDDCANDAFSKGYCRLHYQRWRKHGDATITKKGGSRKGSKHAPDVIARRAASLRRPLLLRFESKYIPEPNSGCWLWLGSRDTKLGYGHLREKGKNVIATHISLQLVGRPVPTGLFACHKCDNPACVNPDHLFIGTQSDNMRDCRRKGRHDYSGLELGRRSHRKPAA